MKSTRNLSLLKRLQRLEAARPRRANTTGEEAFVVLGCFDGERHLEKTSSDAGRCWFQERPGRGPQLADLGLFASVLHLTPAEAEA